MKYSFLDECMEHIEANIIEQTDTKELIYKININD